MSIRNLSYAEVLEAGEEVVQELGADFTYEPIDTENDGSKCVYVHEDAPSCAVGRILTKLGVPLDVLKAMDRAVPGDAPVEGYAIPDYTFARADRLVARGFMPDPKAFVYLATFQDAQDCGMPYGRAHRVAEGAVDGEVTE